MSGRAATGAVGAAAGVLVLALGGACGGPPWYMGSPPGGRPAIPPTSAAPAPSRVRRELVAAAARGRTVEELSALRRLAALEALRPEERARLSALLAARAARWHDRGRAIARLADLRGLIALGTPVPDAALGEAERAAGDAWLAIGEDEGAGAAYDRAARLGVADLEVRRLAAAGLSAPLAPALAAHGLAILPLRATPAFAALYLDAGGRDPALLARGLAGARRAGRPVLEARLRQALPPGSSAPAVGAHPPGAAGAVDEAALPKSEALPPGGPSEDWLLGDLVLIARLEAAARGAPGWLRAQRQGPRYGALLLEEDPTSSDALALAATLDAWAGRWAGARQKVVDMVATSEDREAAWVRAAAIWEAQGRPRWAAAARASAARWRAELPQR